MKNSFFTLLRAILTISIPILILYFLVWQSISFANLSREVKKLSQKKEDLYKKNHDLKSRIASSSSIERIDTLYKKTNKQTSIYSGNKIITLTLPKDKFSENKNSSK